MRTLFYNGCGLGACIALFLIAGCADANDAGVKAEETPAEGVVSANPAGESSGLPATVQDTLLVEGMPQPVTLKLYETPEAFPLPFYTYYPEDLLAQVIEVGDYGETIRFTANFGGTMQDDAVVQLYMLPAGVTEQDARVMMEGTAESHQDAKELDGHRYAWSIAEYVVEDANFVGTYALGEHNGRYFQILVGYPPEYADGFAPRAELVLGQWRWKDTETGLL